MFWSGSSNCLPIYINGIDDDINEAAEQFFVIRLLLGQSQNPEQIIMLQNISLGVIIDDDRKLL